MKTYDLGILAVQNDEFYPFGKQIFFFEDMIKAYKEKDFNILFFSPLDWNQSNEIKGFEYHNGKWKKVSGIIPPLIYDRAFSKNEEEKNTIEHCRDWLTQTGKHILNPFKLADLLNDKMAFHEFLIRHDIPTLKTYSLHSDKIREDNLSFTKHRIFLKPIFGSKGEGIFVIEKVNSGYHLINNLGVLEQVSNISELNELLANKEIDLQRYFLQEEAVIEPFQNAPFDLRVLVQNYGNAYKITGMGVRIGQTHAVTPNLNSGGRAVPVQELSNFLKTTYGRELNQEIEHIEAICLNASTALDQEFGSFLEIGYDILITQQGSIIIEGNAKPSRWVFNVIADYLIAKNKSPEHYHFLRQETVRVPLVYSSYVKNL